MRRDHIIKPGAYETLYGAPSFESDREGWQEWVRQKNAEGAGYPTPEEWHIDNCPGCEAR